MDAEKSKRKHYRSDEELISRLEDDFPKEALGVDKSRGKRFPLTSIKAQYIKERLTHVFGVDGWEISGSWDVSNGPSGSLGGVLFFGTLTVYWSDPSGERSRRVDSVGFAKISQREKDGAQEYSNVGDAYKGAQTDFMSKAASFIGIGNSVFKGQSAGPGVRSVDDEEDGGISGDFKITFGKYRDKRIKEIDPKDFADYCKFIKKESEKEDGSMSPKIRPFLDNARAYFGQMSKK